MPSQPIRRFSIADAMILIVATSIGIVLVRAILPNILAGIMSIVADFAHPPKQGASATVDAWLVALLAASPLLAAWTVALLLLHLRRPRPHLNCMLRQPGAVACVIATLGMAFCATWVIPMWVRGDSALLVALRFVYHGDVGVAVLGGWAVLVLSGRWRPEPSWLDRAGRIIAVTWIAVVVLSRFIQRFPFL
jgi:hypothetical protein